MSGPLLVDEPLPADDRSARVALSRLGEPGGAELHELVSRLGAAEALGQLVRAERTAKGVSAARFCADRLEEDLRHTERLGARVVVPADEEWPQQVDTLPVPPLCLWVRGPARLGEVSARSVAIVGARSATAYGTQVAADLAVGLCERGFAIVSGAAFGIDAAAHRAALAVDGVTVAVLAGGIDRLYPSSHARLLGEIGRVGAVVTEQPPGVAPIGSRFLARNRIIAAMTCGTVVVEASLRSGSLNTAGHAIAAYRPVAAVPGPVTSVQSAGCHAMIRDAKAELVTDAAEVAALVGRLGDDLDPVKRGQSRPGDELDDDLRRLWEVLPLRAFAPLPSLSESAHLSERQVRSGLGRLLATGDAETDGLDGWRKASPDTRRGR